MGNKTCEECRFYFGQANFCRLFAWECIEEDRSCCEDFSPVTNGDVIRQGGDKRLITFATEWSCFHCAYRNGIESKCGKPKDKDCFDGMLAWLNAPAESEVKDE